MLNIIFIYIFTFLVWSFAHFQVGCLFFLLLSFGVFFFVCGTEAYTLSHAPTPIFCEGFFKIGSFGTICPGLASNYDPSNLCLLSYFTGVRNWHLALLLSFNSSLYILSDSLNKYMFCKYFSPSVFSFSFYIFPHFLDTVYYRKEFNLVQSQEQLFSFMHFTLRVVS
jgi:hypothetical protein